MRSENLVRLDTRVAEKPIRAFQLRNIERRRKARRGLLCHPLRKLDQPSLATRIAKFSPRELLTNRSHRSALITRDERMQLKDVRDPEARAPRDRVDDAPRPVRARLGRGARGRARGVSRRAAVRVVLRRFS